MRLHASPYLIRQFYPPLLLLLGCIAAAPAAAQNFDSVLEGIRVQKEHRCSPYLGSDYAYEQSVELQVIELQGGIFSPYDLQCFSDRYKTDIEHMVARSEAHDSGLCSAPAAVRAAFAGDLLNLTLADPALNRDQKVAKDAGDWLPDQNRCWFAYRSALVKKKYGLSMDRAEARALRRVLRRCPSVEMVRPSCVNQP